jgi:CHAD domain-containing protein
VREREAKLVVGRDFQIPRADRLGQGIASATTETLVQRAVYFDTSDLRLTRSGVSLRFRSDDGWTVKLPESRNASSLTRTEYAFAGDRGAPPPRALSLVRAWSRTRPVLEIANIETRRRRTRLVDDRGHLLAELDDDDVVGTSAGETRTRFREIEIELAEDTSDSFLEGALRVLRKCGARSARVMSKIARVLGDAAAEPPDVPDEIELGRNATVSELVRASIVNSLHGLLTRDPELRLGEDPEAVHKARVATRRLRSDLRTLRPIVDPNWSEPLRAELKWLGTALGMVRDADVLLAALARKAERVPDEHQPAAARVQQRLCDARARDRDALLVVLDSDRYARLLDRLVAAAAQPRLRDTDPHTRAASIATRLGSKPRKRFWRAVRTLDDPPRDQDLHEVRKRAKHARYAHELLSPILGKPARRVARRFAGVQQVLGDHQDAVVATAWLSDAARDSEERDEAFVAGEVAGLFLEDKQAARARWPEVRKRVRQAKL